MTLSNTVSRTVLESGTSFNSHPNLKKGKRLKIFLPCVHGASASPQSGLCSKLEINKRHWTGRWKEFEHQKCQDVCRDLNARRLQSQAINKLIAFLGNSQE